MSDRETLFKKYKSLKQYSAKSDNELWALVDKKLSKEKNVIDIDYLFIDKNEKKLGKELIAKYVDQRNFEDAAEIEELKALVYDEVVLQRTRSQINQKYEDHKNLVPEEDLKTADLINKRIVERKKFLKFFDKSEESNDAFQIFEQLKRKAELWYEKNQGTMSIFCPVREDMCLLKIRTDKYECSKHPFFEDRILTNKHLMKLFCEEKITSEDVSLILDCSDDYVNWLITKWKNHPDYKEFIEQYQSKKRAQENA